MPTKNAIISVEGHFVTPSNVIKLSIMILTNKKLPHPEGLNTYLVY